MLEYKYKEVASVKLGDEVECLDCGKKITLTHDTFKLTCEAEYICCPNCGSVRDVMIYLYRKMEDKK